MLRSTLRRQVLALTALAFASACESSTDPSMSDVAGTYAATSFTTTTNGTVTNQLTRGSTLSLVLTAQGTVTGSLVMPDDGTGAVNESMAGSWTLNGSTVDFSQTADTFVRDMTFTSNNGTLTGDQTFSGTRIQVTLTRQ
jgi:hypothetical protein